MVHLQQNGFEVQDGPVATRADLARIRKENGIPAEVASCHTAYVGDYVIEGHVPADVIKDLLRKHPTDVVGLAVPGMPAGSPGMPSSKPKPYTVYAVKADGSKVAFAER